MVGINKVLNKCSVLVLENCGCQREAYWSRLIAKISFFCSQILKVGRGTGWSQKFLTEGGGLLKKG